MQVIILAAGMGKRLGKYTNNNTKCLVEIDGKTLLYRTIEAIKKVGINKVILVCGYQAENLKQYVSEVIKDIEIIWVENTLYDSTNNIYSLFLAKEYLEADDTILLESDVIFDSTLLERVVHSKYKDVVAVAKYEQWMDGTVVLLDEQNNITEFVEKKDFTFEKAQHYYKTVNIYKFSKMFSKMQYVPFLKAYIEAYGKNEYYELVLKAIAHLSKCKLKAVKVEKEKWYEIDDIQDLDIASNMFSDRDNTLMRYQKRFGGYWRFKGLKDFCYLVNPYFPPASLIEKMKYHFTELLINYPSGMYVQNINASRMFKVDEDKIIVGNGAAELINSLKNVIKGKVAVPIPTFNEYIRCLSKCEFEFIDTSMDGYKLNKQRIKECQSKVDCLVIINPDNPSGAFLTYSDMIEIIEAYHAVNKTVIVDESFIDFAESNQRYTLIDNEILEKYPNLIVLKSISKSYGIPGIRLGILCTANREILDLVNSELPVWNINSLGEYFLQNGNLYQDEYVKACDLMAEERNWLFRELDQIEYIRPFKSQANYILCEIIDRYNATELARDLVVDHNIYIKDLSGKDGFKESNYVRIAVKNREDNSELIEVLKKY